MLFLSSLGLKTVGSLGAGPQGRPMRKFFFPLSLSDQKQIFRFFTCLGSWAPKGNIMIFMPLQLIDEPRI